MSEETQIADGYYDAVVRAADIIENRFSPEDGYEVEIEVGVFDEHPMRGTEDYERILCKPAASLYTNIWPGRHDDREALNRGDFAQDVIDCATALRRREHFESVNK